MSPNEIYFNHSILTFIHKSDSLLKIFYERETSVAQQNREKNVQRTSTDIHTVQEERKYKTKRTEWKVFRDLYCITFPIYHSIVVAINVSSVVRDGRTIKTKIPKSNKPNNKCFSEESKVHTISW